MKQKANIKRFLPVIVVCLAIPILAFFIGYWKKNQIPVVVNLDAQEILALPSMSVAELADFNGTNPDKPIYIGLNGFVYDVSSGSEFYAAGNSYHYLAGRDSSQELNMIGGDIIVKKYSVIAKLTD